MTPKPQYHWTARRRRLFIDLCGITCGGALIDLCGIICGRALTINPLDEQIEVGDCPDRYAHLLQLAMTACGLDQWQTVRPKNGDLDVGKALRLPAGHGQIGVNRVV